VACKHTNAFKITPIIINSNRKCKQRTFEGDKWAGEGITLGLKFTAKKILNKLLCLEIKIDFPTLYYKFLTFLDDIKY